jgi:hypothetical protein
MASGIEVVTGVVLLVFGASFLLNGTFWAVSLKRMVAELSLAFPLFLVLLICGVLMVMGHNLWVDDWRVIVTIVGWATLLKSIAILLVPQLLAAYAGWSEIALATAVRAGGVLWLFFGVVVTYFSLVSG